MAEPGMTDAGQADIPESGHRFRIKVAMRGASSILGPGETEPHDYSDWGWETEMHEVVVRAHSLPEALQRAASSVPLNVWMGDDPRQ